MTEIVAICTRNRPGDLAVALTHLRAVAPNIEVLVADASEGELADDVVAQLRAIDRACLLTCRPGLARQRNQALAWLREHRPGTTVVHFIDDDTEVLPGYFDAIESAFAGDPDIAGVGGVVVNQPRPRHVRAKRLFGLYGSRPGVVLPSGRSTIGHYEGDEADDPDWLPGCAMSYRLTHLENKSFDDRLEGYSYGEDMFFSFAVGRSHRLAIAPAAKVVHRLSPANRLSRTRLAYDKVAVLHRFVRENQHQGMRLSAFWFSMLGDIVLKLVDGVTHADRDSLAESGAMLRASLHTLVRPLPARATGP